MSEKKEKCKHDWKSLPLGAPHDKNASHKCTKCKKYRYIVVQTPKKESTYGELLNHCNHIWMPLEDPNKKKTHECVYCGKEEKINVELEKKDGKYRVPVYDRRENPHSKVKVGYAEIDEANNEIRHFIDPKISKEILEGERQPISISFRKEEKRTEIELHVLKISKEVLAISHLKIVLECRTKTDPLDSSSYELIDQFMNKTINGKVCPSFKAILTLSYEED